MENSFITAILEKRVMVLSYHGYTRTVEPHRLFEDENRVIKLFCWQTAGGSDSGESHGWKLLKTQEILSATKTEQRFYSARPGYKAADTTSGCIYAQV